MAKLRSTIAELEANMAALRSSIAKQREYITELEAALSTHLGCDTEELRASFEIGDTNSEIQGRPSC